VPQELKSWNFTSPDNRPVLLSWKGDYLTINEDNISLQSLFETCNPLPSLHLHDQADVFGHIAHHLPAGIRFSSLTSGRLEFWNLHHLMELDSIEINYTTVISQASRWNLKFDKHGLTYQDIDHHYGTSGTLYRQNLADFWFYGPSYPIPDLSLRKTLVEIIRNKLQQIGFSHPDSHFPLIDYPSFVSYPDWVDGDYVASNFVILRSYGIEYGRQNFHDGLVWLDFLSYEQCLMRQDFKSTVLTDETLQSIRNVLKESSLQENV
jgi:hypothetical protein